jgi:ABC-type lipoprotein release transport system permease subunit
MFVDADDSTKVANQLLDGQVALTKLAATRLGVSEGDTVTLPTVEGAHEFTVAQLVEVGIADDSTIGDCADRSASLQCH